MNETVFNGRADAYQAGRPGYPNEAVTFLCGLLPKEGVVADIGSGTGLLTGEFLRRGYTVYGVEPNAQMRAKAETLFSSEKKFYSVAASAEQTCLADQSVDLITAASAFHWFSPEAFRKECSRIMKKDGAIAILFHVRDENDPFTQAQEALCLKYCPRFSSLRHGYLKSLPLLRQFFGEKENILEFSFPLFYQKEAFLSRSLSSSYAPDPQSDAYLSYRDALKALADTFYPGEDMTVANKTVVFYGK